MITDATVFIVDDNNSVRDSLRWLVQSVGLNVETYASAQEFLDSYDYGRAGCLLLDVRMPGMSGLELQEKLAEENIDIPIIIITGHGDVPMAIRAMKSGAMDFIEKPFNDQMLLERIQQAIEVDAKTRTAKSEFDKIQECMDLLTPREREVMDLLALGKCNKTIAAELGLSARTVEIHRGRVLEKMNAGTVCELARMAVQAEGFRT
jgi:two-component system, LuxR family, response regulator FixJ